MQFQSSKRSQKVHYAIRDIVVEASKLIPADKKVLPLNIGDPIKFDFTTPKHILKAFSDNLSKFSSYAPSEGTDEARDAVLALQKKWGVKNLSRNEILITNGGADAINLVLNAIINPGDAVLLPSPGYPAYDAQVDFLDGEKQYYLLDEENDWQIDISSLEKNCSNKTKSLVLINPNNPTGAILTKKNLTDVLKFARKNNIIVIADEQVYQEYVFEGSMTMCANLGIETPVISVGSMSKTYLVPGWRVGWIVFFDPLNEMNDVKEAVFKIKRVQIGSIHPAQTALATALNGPHDFLNEVKSKLKKRRDIIFEGINNIDGLSLVKPAGAFYAFVKINKKISSDKQFVLDLAKEEGILTVPGEGFGQKEGTKHFRIVFLPQEDVLQEAIRKIERFVKRY